MLASHIAITLATKTYSLSSLVCKLKKEIVPTVQTLAANLWLHFHRMGTNKESAYDFFYTVEGFKSEKLYLSHNNPITYTE